MTWPRLAGALIQLDADLRALEVPWTLVADDDEIHRARRGLELISRRGADRGKDLAREFEE